MTDKEESKQEDLIPKKAKAPYRGKASAKSHDDDFRRKSGQKAMAANDARIDQNLFAHLTAVVNKLKSFDHEPEPLTATIPQTTRGLGFTTQLSFNELATRRPNMQVDVFQLYRTTLAYHQYIRHKSYAQGTRYRPMAPEREFEVELFMGFTQVVENNSRTFSAIAAALSCFGNVELAGENFHGFHPQSGIRYTVERAGSSGSSGRSVRTKRGKQPDPPPPHNDVEVERVQVASQLNPYAVCLANLRTVVTELANPAVSQDLRAYFVERNPIPGAIFNNNFLLQNPDEIIPPVYGQSQLANDFRFLRACMDTASKNFAHFFTEVNLSGKTHAACFVNAQLEARILDNEVLVNREDHVAFRKISASHYILGVVGLAGERCDRQLSSFEVYGLRRMQSGIERINAYWIQIVESLYYK